MLGSFEELEKDIEKFQNNVMASSELIESLNDAVEAIRIQTAAVDRVSTEVPSRITETTDSAVKRMGDAVEVAVHRAIDSNQNMADKIIAKDVELQVKLESVPGEMKESLLDHQREITSQNEEYLKNCAGTFEKAQQEYLVQLMDNQASLDACRKQLEEAHTSFIKKAEELDLDALQHSVEQITSDVVKKLNIITIISVIAALAAVASIFIK